jgi:hypothetical protein
MLNAFVIQVIRQISIIAIYQTENSRYYGSNETDIVAVSYGSNGVCSYGLEFNIHFVLVTSILQPNLMTYNFIIKWL